MAHKSCDTQRAPTSVCVEYVRLKKQVKPKAIHAQAALGSELEAAAKVQMCQNTATGGWLPVVTLTLLTLPAI